MMLIPKKTLAVVALSYNEERDLPEFIEHLSTWVNEIIIIDDGSTDNTITIAKSYGNKIKLITNQMIEKDFAFQRNVGISIATSEWILHMDIDERVSPELAQEICEKIGSDIYNGYRYKRLNFFLHRPMKGGNWQTWNHPQLARRGFHEFKNQIHEECVIKGKIASLKGFMWHYNDENYLERLRKSFQYSNMEAKKILVKHKRVTWLHFIAKPIIKFLKVYFYHKGFKDGTVGLISAIHSMDAEFRAYAIAWDKQNYIQRQKIEEDFRQQWREAVDYIKR